MMEIKYIISGVAVGFLTGLTGIGGGSLMTPILILFLGISPVKAVGTDLLFNAITKVVGVMVFHKRNHVNWKTVGLLALGSIPATILCIFLLRWLNVHNHDVNFLLKKAVGVIIIISTSFFLIATEFKPLIKRFFYREHYQIQSGTRLHTILIILSGAIVGTVVTFTSIGSGILGTTALILLNPEWLPTWIVATEMAHTIPITLLAGLGYVSLGHINFNLLIGLLIGSIPAAYFGSQLANRIPHRFLKFLIVTFLLLAAFQLLLN